MKAGNVLNASISEISSFQLVFATFVNALKEWHAKNERLKSSNKS